MLWKIVEKFVLVLVHWGLFLPPFVTLHKISLSHSTQKLRQSCRVNEQMSSMLESQQAQNLESAELQEK